LGGPTQINEHQCAHHSKAGDKDISNDVFFIYFVELRVCLSAPHMFGIENAGFGFITWITSNSNSRMSPQSAEENCVLYPKRKALSV
jgi:hypothetical protein